MITDIYPTTDFNYIRKSVIDPYVWRWAHDDTSPKPELYFPTINESVTWLRMWDHGVLMAQVIAPSVFEVHVALNRNARGMGVALCRKALDWCRDNFEKPYTLIANIPVRNQLATRLAKQLGFVCVGQSEVPLVRDGKHYRRDKYILREEA